MKKLTFTFIALFLASCGKDPVNPTPPNPVGPGVTKVLIGTPAISGQTYEWVPSDSVTDPKIAQPYAFPKKTTTYTVTASSPCGKAASKMTVHVYKKGPDGNLIEIK